MKKAHILLFIGVGFLILFVFAFMLQIATTEAFVTSGAQVSISNPNWSILWQLPSLVQGQLSPGEASAAFVGWFVELLYLGFIVAGEVMTKTVKAHNPGFARLFQTIVILAVILNMVMDFQYGSVGLSGWQGHLLFAVILSLCVGFAGIISLACIEEGWSHI